jgi:hypothetical protein
MQRSELRFTRGSARRGSTLVVVALLMAAMAMLSLSLLTVLRSSHKESQGSRESLSALYACEAGLTRAVDSLATGGTGSIASKQEPEALGDQRYWVEATPIGDGRIALQAYGRDDRALLGVEMVVQPSSQGFFRWAAFGDEDMHMEAQTGTDSYDSGDGDYAAVNGTMPHVYANTEGDIGSNQSISMDSNVGVWGDANPGPGDSVTGDLSKISGNTTPMPATVDLPDIVLPFPASGTNLTVESATTLASGTYAYSTLQVNSSKTLTINGPATIVCDNFKLKSGSQLIVNDANGPVEFFVVNDFVLNSNTTIQSSDLEPLDIAFNLLSDNILDPGVDVDFDEDLVDFDSGSMMYGTIYAPSASVTVDSNFELFGSLVARRVDLDSNCRIHFDEALAEASEDSEAVYETLTWRLTSQP